MTDHNNLAPAASPAAGARLASIQAALHDLASAVDDLKTSTTILSTSTLADIISAVTDVNDAADDVSDAANRVFTAVTNAPAHVLAAAAAPAAPAPAAPTPAAAGLTRTTAPWTAGLLYSVAPLAPLQAVPDNGEKWFAITRGKYVGLTKNSAISLNAVTGVPGGLAEKFSAQSDALEYFNGALVSGAVAVIYYRSSLAPILPFFPSHLAVMSTPPPDYGDIDLPSLLRDLNIDNVSDTRPRTLARDRSTLAAPTSQQRTPSPPPAPALRSSDAPEESSRLYHWSSPTGSGYTTDWEFAAAQTQGIAGGTSSRLTPQRKSGGKKGGYAVFVGKQIGAFKHWREVQPLVNGVPSAIYQGYPTLQAATAAFEYARERTWTRQAFRPSARPPASPPAIPHLPAPMGLSDAVNPLHGAVGVTDEGVWYIVYCGIAPGVYQSSLECLLNTLGIPGARYDSCDSKEAAVARYQNALSGGRVQVVNPSYSRS
ncbi:hypothetical protein B0H11DRAFT_1918679 [Mycena galericulata]|nr:hypothetical protein B0H11DRAFT_1918679 [Mycena galericulata]